MSSAASRFVSERDLDAARTENRRSVLERLGAKESSGAEDHRPLYERLQEQRRDQEARRAESGHYVPTTSLDDEDRGFLRAQAEAQAAAEARRDAEDRARVVELLSRRARGPDEEDGRLDAGIAFGPNSGARQPLGPDADRPRPKRRRAVARPRPPADGVSDPVAVENPRTLREEEPGTSEIPRSAEGDRPTAAADSGNGEEGGSGGDPSALDLLLGIYG